MNLMELAVKSKIPIVEKNIPIPDGPKKRRGRPPGSKNKSKVTPIPELDSKKIEKGTIDNILAKRLLPFLNKPVQYYDEGWRGGTLFSITDNIAIVIHPMHGKQKVPVENVKGWENESLA